MPNLKAVKEVLEKYLNKNITHYYFINDFNDLKTINDNTEDFVTNVEAKNDWILVSSEDDSPIFNNLRVMVNPKHVDLVKKLFKLSEIVYSSITDSDFKSEFDTFYALYEYFSTFVKAFGLEDSVSYLDSIDEEFLYKDNMWEEFSADDNSIDDRKIEQLD